MSSSRQSVQVGLDALSLRMDPIIGKKLADVLRGLPWTSILSELDRAKGHPPRTYSAGDLQSQLRMITERLGALGYPFDDHVRTVSVLGGELRIVRNRWAHHDDFTVLDAWRAHDFSTRLLEQLGDHEGAVQAQSLRNSLSSLVFTEMGIEPHPISQDPSCAAESSEPNGDEETVLQRDSPTSYTAPTEESEYVAPDDEVYQRESGVETPTIGPQRLEYEPWNIVIVGDIGTLDALPKKYAKEKVRALAAEIVEFEGPVHIERLAQLIAGAFDVNRLHAARSKRIEYQVRAAGLMIDKHKFVWSDALAAESWREFRPNSSDANRNFVHISPDELSNAAKFIGKHHGSELTRVELERKVLQTFGRKRRTRQFVAHLRRGLD